MPDKEPTQRTPKGREIPAQKHGDFLANLEKTAPKVKSEEALVRSKADVTPSFKEPKAPKKSGRWPPSRSIGSRPPR